MPDVGDRNEQYDKLLEDMKARAEPLGLYMEAAVIQTAPPELGLREGTQLVLAHYLIGERAFRPAVQDPEQAAFDEQFRGIRMDAEEDEWDEQRRQLEQDLKDLGDDA